MYETFLTLLRISVLSRSFISMLKASSFSCGPRLQEIVIHALPGRSQSFQKEEREKQGERKGQKKVCGREKCDKQMLQWLKKQEPSQGVTVGDLWKVKVRLEGWIFTKTLRPDLVKNANMEWKMLSRSWGMVHGVGFLWGVQLPRPSATWNRQWWIKTFRF